MKFIKLALHQHIRAGGAQNMLDEYKKQNFGAVFATDHVSKGPGSNFTFNYSEERKLFKKEKILLFEGAQLSSGHHVCVIKGNSEIIKIINHPMRYNDNAGKINRLADKIGADFVEITEHSKKLDQYPDLDEAIRDLKPLPVVSDDAHGAGAIGRAYLIVEVKNNTKDEILNAMKKGNYAIHV